MTDFQEAPKAKIGERILVIVAHHDDIEFGIAGSVARWVDEGAEVTYCIITDGSAGSNDPETRRADLAETRRIEQRTAATLLQVEDVRFLNYEDGTLEPSLGLRKDLTRIIRDVRPHRVVCQDPTTVFFGEGYVNHPDHRAAGEAAIYATFPGAESRPIFADLLEEDNGDDDEGYQPHKVEELYLTLTNKPTHYIDISDYIDRKMSALRAHESQIGTGDEAENGAVKYIRERNAESGEQVGVAYAEFFKVMTLVRANEVDEDALQATAAAGAVGKAAGESDDSGSDEGSDDDEAKMSARRDDSIDTNELQSEVEKKEDS
jgi:LmbE family N-acetylglucosaminyl deacetylase